MAREYTVMVEEGEDSYLVGSALGLPGAPTQARTLDELMSRMREAILLCLEELGDTEPQETPRFAGIHHILV
jgi:predicted RNase H-like HicB family nuclease